MGTRLRQSWRIGVGIAIATLAIAALETSRNYASNVLWGRDVSWWSNFVSTLPTWAIIAALTPLPIWLAWRMPIVRDRVWRAVGVHAAGLIGFTVTHVALVATYFALEQNSSVNLAGTIGKFGSTVPADIAVYIAIVGAVHALRYHREAQERALAAAQLQEHLTRARLAALQGQLHPHFLFNTLNAISTMALAGRQDDVVRMLGYLGELLRVTLDDERPQEVPLRAELEFLARYLDLQQARLGDRLRVHQTIAPDAMDAMVPSMLLQPLVENAIGHGIAPIPGPGDLVIAARIAGDRLEVEVGDSGPGFQATSDRRQRHGIGLANTRARLAQLYGGAERLTTGDRPEGGGLVSISLPLRRATA